MTPLPWSVRIYIAGMVLLVTCLAIPAVLRADPLALSDLILAVVLGGLMMVAWLEPFPLSFKRKLYLDTSVVVAAILLLQPGIAMIAVGAGTLLAQIIRRQGLGQSAFNAAQTMLQAGAGGLIVTGAGGRTSADSVGDPPILALVLIASAVIFLISNVSVATAIALETETSPFKLWLNTIRHASREEFYIYLAQVGLGIIAAILIDAAPWTLPLLVGLVIVIAVLLKRNIELRRRAEDNLQLRDASLAEAQRLASLGSWGWDLVAGDVRWSDETFRILGLKPGAIKPTFDAFLRAVHPDDRKLVDLTVHDAIRRSDSFAFHHRVRTPDGAERIVYQQGLVVVENGQKVRIAGTLLDISERWALESQLAHRASHDPLTGLPNRACLLERLAAAIAARDRRSPVAVLFVDLDGFKLVNDGLGHDAGDEALVEAGRRLVAASRSSDTVARVGGDEFVLVLAPSTPTQATAVARRIVAAFSLPFQLKETEAIIGASIGIAISGSELKQPEDLLQAADTALYHAKGSMSGGWSVFEPAMRAEAMARLEMITALKSAVDRNEFRLCYQPEIELATGRVVGCEALIRWHRTQEITHLPLDFIPIAEATGSIVAIGEWVLTEACRQGREWQQQGGEAAPLRMGVNVSVRQLRDPGFIDRAERILRETGFPAHLLRLEITENVLLDADESDHQILHELKTLGVQLAIDDFGTGYSSLSYLRQVPIDVLKIDRSFASGLSAKGADRAIVDSIVSLAHTLGMNVTAEGIESEAQLLGAKDVGVDSAQGYHLAPPLAPEAVRPFLTCGRTTSFGPGEGMADSRNGSTLQRTQAASSARRVRSTRVRLTKPADVDEADLRRSYRDSRPSEH
jgi:diguanylate cyclase (GGDEF)-like protein